MMIADKSIRQVVKAFRLKKHAIGCLIFLQIAVCSYADSLINITESCQNHIIYMLWFKFIHGLMFFELVSILFAIVPDYGNEYL